MQKIEKKKLGFIELRLQKLNEQFTRVEIDFKGRFIWTTCKSGEERNAIVELLKELFEDEFTSILKICEEMKIDINELFKVEEIKS
jgi:hypothetical protein